MGLKVKDEKDDFEEEEEETKPRRPGEAPDGGFGWVIVVGSFVCNLVVEGLTSTYGVLNIDVSESFDVPSSASVVVGSMLAGFYLTAGPVASALANRFGCRKVTMFGSVMTCIAFLVSTHMPTIPLLTLTYGVLGGIGLGLIYLPAIVIVGHWFEKKRAFATGLAVCGSGVGTLLVPQIYKKLLRDYDWKGTTVIVAGLTLHCLASGALFRPLTRTSAKRMKRGVIQRGSIMKALIAEKERQRTISNGSLDNCIITRDNRLIKIDKIDLANKSTSFLHRLKENFGFSSRSLNKSKNSLIMPKIVVDPIYRPKSTSPRISPSPLRTSSPKATPSPRIKVKAISTPPTPKRDSGCGSLESPKFSGDVKSRSYDSIPTEDPWDRLAEEGSLNNKALSVTNVMTSPNSEESSPNSPEDKSSRNLDPGVTQSVPVSPINSAYNLNVALNGHVNCLSKHVNRSESLPNGNAVLPSSVCTSLMTVPQFSASVQSIEASYYEEDDCCGCSRHIVNMFDLKLFKKKTFILLSVSSFFSMLGYFIPYMHLPRKSVAMKLDNDGAFLISLLGIANLFGRVIAGWIADRPWADPVCLNNVALVIAGVLSFMNPFYSNITWMGLYAVGFGFFTAAFLALRSILLVELLGKEKLTSSFGLLILFQGIAVMIGAPIAGALDESLGNIDIGFYMAGAFLTFAGILGIPLRRIKKWEDEQPTSQMMRIISIEELPMTGPETLKIDNMESTI